jgi:predicted PhzF superfamily epimerase YddE/YHI9
MTDLRLHAMRTTVFALSAEGSNPCPIGLGFGEKSGGWHDFSIEQGQAMGRASIIEVDARVEHSRIVAIRMTGHAKVLGEEDTTLAAG